VRREGLIIHTLSGDDIRPEHWDAFFAFYMDTGGRKWGTPYLTRSFFDILGSTMADKVVLVLAEADGRPVGGALNLKGDDTLYGNSVGATETLRGGAGNDLLVANGGLSRLEGGAGNDSLFAANGSGTGETLRGGDDNDVLTDSDTAAAHHLFQGGSGDEAAMPEGMSLGQFSFTATFPGPISSITGNGATKVDENTVTVAGSLSENFNVTVVASSEPSGSAVKLLILVLLAIAVLAVFAVAMVLLRKGKKQEAPAETAAAEPVKDVPPTADSSDPSI
jgi:hypothetical protein